MFTGYAGPLPRGGWAMEGNTTCIPIPKEGDLEMLLPEMTLDIEASGAVLIEGSKERVRFERQLVIDVAESMDVKRTDVLITNIGPALRRLQALEDASSAGRRQLQGGYRKHTSYLQLLVFSWI